MKSNLAHITKAVITNANNIMALSVLRSLGRQGVPIIALFGKNSQHRQPYAGIVGSSRFIAEKYWFDEVDYESNFIQGLSDIGNALSSKAVLFPLSDEDMMLMSRHREYLQNYYHFLMPPDDMLTLLLNKEKFYEFATRENLAIPRTFLPGSSADISTIGRQVRYPCIIKPSWRTEKWVRRYKSRKVIKCDSPEELSEYFRQVSQEFSGLTVQEVVPGPESNIVCSFTYLDRQSEPLGMFLCRKIRQFPPDFGNTSLAEALAAPEVEHITRQICKQLALVGYVGIEFKLDPRDNAYKILEITPSRINRQVGLSDTCGINIPYIWYAYLLGLHVKVDVSEKPYRWASEVNEVRSLGCYLKRRDWTIGAWLRSYRNVRKWEVFASDDLSPFLMLMTSMLHGKLRHFDDTKIAVINPSDKTEAKEVKSNTKAYYYIKPIIPRRLQIFLRRLVVKMNMPKYAHIWPIDESASKKPLEWKGWPEGKKFALVLTHDVEKACGHDRCMELMLLEEALGFHSSFNFVPERYTVSPDLRYLLQGRNFEVGVHGLRHDGKYYGSKEIFRRRAKKINSYIREWDVVGYRAPCMLHKLDWFHDLCIEYDASTFDTDPFEPHSVGMGTIFPFLIKGKSGEREYVELPYTLPQDHALFVIMKERTIDIWKKKLDWVAHHGGMALVITHPDYMNFNNTTCGLEEYPAALYREFLEYIKSRYEGQYWHVLPREMARFWRDNK